VRPGIRNDTGKNQRNQVRPTDPEDVAGAKELAQGRLGSGPFRHDNDDVNGNGDVKNGQRTTPTPEHRSAANDTGAKQRQRKRPGKQHRAEHHPGKRLRPRPGNDNDDGNPGSDYSSPANDYSTGTSNDTETANEEGDNRSSALTRGARAQSPRNTVRLPNRLIESVSRRRKCVVHSHLSGR
jgi:hypothetical protein